MPESPSPEVCVAGEAEGEGSDDPSAVAAAGSRRGVLTRLNLQISEC